MPKTYPLRVRYILARDAKEAIDEYYEKTAEWTTYTNKSKAAKTLKKLFPGDIEMKVWRCYQDFEHNRGYIAAHREYLA